MTGEIGLDNENGAICEVVWPLPFKSQELMEGPELVHRSGEVVLRLDHEEPSGTYAWSSIIFRGAHALRFTAHASCTREQVQAYDRLVVVPRSAWLLELRGAPEGATHYRIYLDDVGCYEIVATSFVTSGTEGADTGARRERSERAS